MAFDTCGPLSAYAGIVPMKSAAAAVATSAAALLSAFRSVLMIVVQSEL
jgi:hypothetical protein